VKRETAEKVAQLLQKAQSALGESAQFVGESEPEAFAKEYCRLIGRVVWDIHVDLLNEIYEEHPELKPAGLR